MQDSFEALEMFEKVRRMNTAQVHENYPKHSEEKRELSKALFYLVCVGKSAFQQLKRLHGFTEMPDEAAAVTAGRERSGSPG